MLNVSIDEGEVKKMTREEIQRVLREMDTDYVYWDIKELTRRTCMSITFIKEQFFYDKRFPKKKIGSKWYFPVEETKEFLIIWLSEQ